MRLIPLAIIAVITIIACNKKTETSETTHEVSEESTKHICYAHLENKDTVTMALTIQDKTVSGELTYKIFEKDRNYGQFNGTISGDTIVAEYQFQSEGVTSVREVKFLRKGTMLVEGYENQFNGMVLTEVTCNE